MDNREKVAEFLYEAHARRIMLTRPWGEIVDTAKATWRKSATKLLALLAPPEAAEPVGVGARTLRFDVSAPGEPGAGLHGYSDIIEVMVDSGNVGDPDRDFPAFLIDALKEWFDGAEVELSADYLASPAPTPGEARKESMGLDIQGKLSGQIDEPPELPSERPEAVGWVYPDSIAAFQDEENPLDHMIVFDGVPERPECVLLFTRPPSAPEPEK